MKKHSWLLSGGKGEKAATRNEMLEYKSVRCNLDSITELIDHACVPEKG